MDTKTRPQSGTLYRGYAIAPLDKRGQVTLPLFVRTVSETNFGIRSVYLTRHESEPCIVGFGNSELYQPFSRAEVLSMKEGGGPSFLSGRFAVAETVQWNRRGRIILSRLLQTSAGIEDEILFVGTGNVFEMWSPAVALQSKDQGLRSMAIHHARDGRGQKPKVRSAGWTGQFSPADHARFVRSLVPEATSALEQIIASYEVKLDNFPPEPLDAEQLAILRQLHSELGALLQAIDDGRPMAAALARIRKLSRGMWAIGRRSQRLLLRSSPALAASVPASFALIKILELMLGYFEPLGRAGVAAAVTGGILKFGVKEPRP